MLAVRPSATMGFSSESLTDPSNNLFSQIDCHQHDYYWSGQCWADIYVALHEGLDVSQVPRSSHGKPQDSIGHFLVTRAYSCAVRLDICIRRGFSVATCCDRDNKTILQCILDKDLLSRMVRSSTATLCSIQVLADAGARLRHDGATAKGTKLMINKYLKNRHPIPPFKPIIEQIDNIFDNKTLP
jgi:hypothetical protein